MVGSGGCRSGLGSGRVVVMSIQGEFWIDIRGVGRARQRLQLLKSVDEQFQQNYLCS
ncbi:hypothetical protein QQ045_005484 [Rhodiola kirilowii]